MQSRLPETFDELQNEFVYPDGSRVGPSGRHTGYWYGKRPDGCYLTTEAGSLVMEPSPFRVADALEAAGFGPTSLPNS